MSARAPARDAALGTLFLVRFGASVTSFVLFARLFVEGGLCPSFDCRVHPSKHSADLFSKAVSPSLQMHATPFPSKINSMAAFGCGFWSAGSFFAPSSFPPRHLCAFYVRNTSQPLPSVPSRLFQALERV